MHTRRKRRAGLSLAELMVALGVIAVGMSGVAASLIFGFQKSNHGDRIAIATNHARILVDLIQNRSLISLAPVKDGNGLPDAASGLNDAANAQPRPISDAPFQQNDFTMPERDLSNYKRKITMVRRGAVNTEQGNLVTVTVNIYWEDEGVPRHAATSAVVFAPRS